MTSTIAAIFLCFLASIQTAKATEFPYDQSQVQPFGLINPKAEAAVADYSDLIGEWNCQIQIRKDNKWSPKEAMLWRFKYIMNGLAVQDETLKQGGVHTGSIRQYDLESKQWQVHYYSLVKNKSTNDGSLPVWVGGKQNNKLVFKRQQPATDGTVGFYRLTFFDIEMTGFKWEGAWVNEDASVVYPTRRIACKTK